MTEPTTAAGRALGEFWRLHRVGFHGGDVQDAIGDDIAAIEAEARQQERERIRAAIVSLKDDDSWWTWGELAAILADEPQPIGNPPSSGPPYNDERVPL